MHVGKTVTTDAVYRETLIKELKWRTAGVLAVDMEVSALFTVAKYYHIPAVTLLVVSDTHELVDNGNWHWGGQKLDENRPAILKKYVEFIQTN